MRASLPFLAFRTRSGARVRLATALFVPPVVALAACFSDRPATGPSQPASGDAVSIQNFAFVPPNLSVVSGTTVTWTNKDSEQHTVSSDDGHSFESSAFGRNQTFRFTAGAPGTYTYTCRIHPFMHGTLTVTAP
jgi:plastocyanin